MKIPGFVTLAVFPLLSACWQTTEPLPPGTIVVPPATPVVPDSELSPIAPDGIHFASPTQAQAVDYAWQQFVALNWPALAGQRGVPDTTRLIGMPGTVVWETWKDPSEVFLPDGSQPVPWDQYGGTVPPECQGAQPADFVLRRISKSPHDSDNPVFEGQKQAVGGTLTDQHGLLTRYEIRLSQVTFNDILENTWYNVQGQDASASIQFDWTAMEAKAAWRIFTSADSPSTRARYYSREAWIYTPAMGPNPATCVQDTVALVGLHITQKTVQQPQWTWATFEQIDNVPPFGTENPPPPGVAWSYNDPACPPKVCVPNQSTENSGQPTTVPTQVTRQINIGTDAAAANPVWQARLNGAVPGSVWQYYQLVDIQWPQNPTFDAFGDPTPLLLSNTTMETYVPQSSCLGCHYTADIASNTKPADFTFMLAEAYPALTTGAKK